MAAEVSTSGLGSVTPPTLPLHDAACRPADQLTAGRCTLQHAEPESTAETVMSPVPLRDEESCQAP